MDSHALGEALIGAALIIAVLVVLLIVALHRLNMKMHEVKVAQCERDCWINTAAECMRDGGEMLRKNPRLNKGILETLDKAGKSNSKGCVHAREVDAGT